MSAIYKPSSNENESLSELEHGSFAPLESVINKSSLIIATYNIRYAVGSFLITGSLFRRVGIKRPRRRPRLVAGNIEKAARAFSDGLLMPAPDVIALQEADVRTRRTGGHHVARELAERLQMNYVHAPMHIPRGVAPKSRQWWLDFEEQIGIDETGDTGVAILSRLPLEETARIDLPWDECAWRPRVAITASIMMGPKRIQLFNAHIDPHAAAGNQIKQHETILELANRIDGPIILLGDFNTLTPDSLAATRCLLESHGFTTPIPSGTGTWRAGLYRLHADWIFVRGGVQVKRWGVARRLSVSDHWPIWAEIGFE